MDELLLKLCIVLSSGFFCWKRLMRYLRYFQQEDYSSKRFFLWWKSNQAFDKRGSLFAFISSNIRFLTAFPILDTLFFSIPLISIAFFEEDPRKHGKKKLVLTARAKRILLTAFCINFLLVSISSFFSMTTLLFLQIFIFQSTPFCLPAACWILSWDESSRQKKLLEEAKQILKETNTFVIGITGSYGKTSTKNALGHILQATLSPVFWPEKGINTPMGITREIKNHLKPGMQYSVIEMGAYGKGSIEKICHLTPPDAAIITTIGTAHLERFGSQDTIRQTKAELAAAVPQTGILVCNGDNPGTRQIASEYPKKTTLLYGFEKNLGSLDCHIKQWKTISQGTEFTLQWKGKEYPGFTKLHGKPALSNLAAAFTLSCALGSNPEYTLASIHTLEPVDNRLQVQKVGKTTYIKDAYNSNPDGFEAALEVMKDLPGKRRILMTPGMIELGPLQEIEHVRLAKKSAEICDIVIIVGELNKNSLLKGLKEAKFDEKNIFLCSTREIAFMKLKEIQQDDDIILIENDLADVHEKGIKF